MKKIFKSLIIFVLALTFVFGLTACSMAEEDNNYADNGSVDETVVVDNQTGNKKVAVTKYIYVEEESKSVKSKKEFIEEKTTSFGGTVMKIDSSSYSGGLYYAYITVKVPTDNLTEFLSAVKGKCNVTTENTVEKDLTEEYNKNSARINEINEKISYLEDLRDNESPTVADKIEILKLLEGYNKEKGELTDKNSVFGDTSYTKVFISINGVEPEDTTPRTVFLILLGVVVLVVVVINVLKLKNGKKQQKKQNQSQNNQPNDNNNDFFNNNDN